jgi:outer membrane protein TolC
VEDNRSLLAHLGEEERAASAGTGAARQTADAALDLYREGATSYLDVVTAQTALLQNRQALLDVRTREFVATVNLIRALGGGWGEEM